MFGTACPSPLTFRNLCTQQTLPHAGSRGDAGCGSQNAPRSNFLKSFFLFQPIASVDCRPLAQLTKKRQQPTRRLLLFVLLSLSLLFSFFVLFFCCFVLLFVSLLTFTGCILHLLIPGGILTTHACCSSSLLLLVLLLFRPSFCVRCVVRLVSLSVCGYILFRHMKKMVRLRILTWRRDLLLAGAAILAWRRDLLLAAAAT